MPRATGDLDLWVRPSPDNADRVLRALREFGAPTTDLTSEDLVSPDVVVEIGVEPRRIDIRTSIDGVEFDAAWPDREQIEVEGIELPVLGRRDFIANKRAPGRPQDLADVARLEAGEA